MKKVQDKKTEMELTEIELMMLQDLTNKKQAAANEFAAIGQLEANVAIRKENNLKQYKENIELEEQISTSLTKKYGNGTIDTDRGVFIPS